MRAGLVGAIAVAVCAWPAAARAAPVVILTAPDGSRVALQDAPRASELAKLPPVSVDRHGYITAFAFCVQTLRPGRACERIPLPTVDDPVRIVEAGTSVGGAVPAEAATVELMLTEGPPLRVPAQPGDCRGAFAGRVRFLLAMTRLQVTRRAPGGPSEDCLDDGPGRVRVVATCAPRLVHVFGLGRATLVLAGGRRRTVRARHGAFHAVLRGHEALRRVIEGRRSVRLRTPPPAEQCGYRAEARITG